MGKNLSSVQFSSKNFIQVLFFTNGGKQMNDFIPTVLYSFILLGVLLGSAAVIEKIIESFFSEDVEKFLQYLETNDEED